MTLATLGSAVPDFEIAATGDKTVKLSDYRGKKVILYFYPKDSTPGCTLEGQGFRDNIEQFNQLNTVILGISRDSIKMHEGF